MRARNIKPGFYANPELAECSVWARLLAPGLWMMADRDGRLQDRPKLIKGEIFRYDNIDIEPLLQELHSIKHIHRYEIDGVKYIQILEFNKHQSPHYSEKPSSIPSPFSEDSENFISSSNEIPKSIQRTPKPQPPDLLNPDLLNPDSVDDRDVFVLPAWIKIDVWEAFMEIRKAKKAADTDRAKKSLIHRLDGFMKAGHDPNDVIENSIRNSWKDVFEPKQTNHPKSPFVPMRKPATGVHL